MIEIDGSYLEGGGQIVRTALALSTLTGRPFKVKDIRKGRPKSGLKNQHLTAIKTLAGMCNAEVKGAEPGSGFLEYYPEKIDFRNLNIDIGTAGSITLLLQAVLPVCLFADRKMKIQVKGGTDTEHSMPVDYFINVLVPHLRRYADFEITLEKRGYYPKGGGRLTIRLAPKHELGKKGFSEILSQLRGNPIKITEQSRLVAVFGVSHASKDLMKANVAERQAKSAKFLLGKYDASAKISVQYSDTLSAGSGITLWAMFSDRDEMDFSDPVILGADSLGERGKKAENVGMEAAERLARQIDSNAPVDKYLADQLLPYLAFSGGEIKVSEITEHAKTNMHVIEKFLDVKFKTKQNIISCLYQQG
ncbi:TPA: RNA 3'-terminal phosphate cyclase [Candidatus Woesearchaeota archaeon]|nr:RNA 3'-terminal phosphate cyclase [archaeon GW2011_AR15]MBS3104208.1 RNA 3'-terminal phosphate cyclase [Candidatus Woesearchaeota archaeon]HIH41962.1 RNA 3'-terminal phosphate cyclase [Candidatus Woesearchaeota archaeon]